MAGKSESTMTVTTPSDREIVMTRVFDAPRDLVFEAHTSCEHMEQWWGPRRYQVVDCKIVRPEKIVWTFEFEGMPGHVSVDTLTLEEQDGKTRLTATSVFDSVEDRDGMLNSGMEEGAAETWDRLAEYLAMMR
jgi:uncharacterized protein YndB with AHSA1/START domain